MSRGLTDPVTGQAAGRTNFKSPSSLTDQLYDPGSQIFLSVFLIFTVFPQQLRVLDISHLEIS